jgi:putative transposase
MNENSVVSLRQKDEIDDPLTEILRTGARRLITRVVEVEFDTFLASNSDLGHCHGASGLRSHWRFGSQRDEENQLQRVPVPS